MKIALDAMGGDCGSEVLINGAAQAVKKHPNIEVLLLGPEELLREKLARLGKVDTPRLSIVHAPQTISMAEEAVEAVRRKKDSTVMVGFDLVRQGQAEAMVSAGHSGATMAAAMPVGINVFMLAQKYEAGIEAVSTAILISTSLSLVTISLLLAIFI